VDVNSILKKKGSKPGVAIPVKAKEAKKPAKNITV
jgi:hypothetical protein